MKKFALSLVLLGGAWIAGCGGSGTSMTMTSAKVSGAVADGYLQNAQVFLDRNGNYQLDAGEPSTTTDQNGAYTLDVAQSDLGRYPIVAVAIAGTTVDMDNPGQPVQKSYVLCLPGAATSGTVSNFISPMSTLIREKLEANPGMTLNEAITQLRNELGMPPGMNMLGNYVSGSASGPYQAQYQVMHQVARQMATMMADQAGQVMNGTSPNSTRFRAMMGLIGGNLPQMVDWVNHGQVMSTDFRNAMTAQMQSAFGSSSPPVFSAMTSFRHFWNYSGTTMRPRHGMMGR